ncbi:MAG TPA: AIR synthase-related protein, partial [Chitinophagales bacterium]|nr:AIR synthase-related protein [Chitinophagales bacterium]
VIVGLASYGKSIYETAYNGGMGSNGLTSARHDVFHHQYADKYPESFSPEIPREVVYSGSKSLTDEITVNNEKITLGKLVLSPTRTYLPVIRTMLENHSDAIKGMIHCSGGGQTKVLHFADKVHIVKDNLFATPPLFDIIQQESGTSWKEMYRTFNMGCRLEIYTDQNTAESLINIAKSFDIEAQIIGHVMPSENKKLTVKSAYGEFEY